MFKVSMADAQKEFPEYKFVKALTPSAQKAAFHVKDRLGRDLCFKIISPDCDIERVTREIQALMSIRHPNVVTLVHYVRDVTPNKSRHFMIEEFIEGDDLEAELSDDEMWLESYASEVFSQLCDGLAALHSENIVHRDLKPANIRLRKDSNAPVIIDFGLARLLTKPDLTKTTDGAKLGTPLYFAPEQWRGTKNDIDHRVDLFALGLMLYKALTGKHAFYHKNMSMDGIEEAVCASDKPFSEKEFQLLSDGWKLIVKKLLEKERGKRPNSAAQVSKILRKLGANNA